MTIRFFLSHLFLFFASVVQAEFKVPPLSSPVVDQAQVLSQKSQQVIANEIQSFYKVTGNQLAILIVPSLQGEVLERASIQVVEKWKLGSEKKDNGLLILLAIKERAVRIEVGQGLEGVITDLYSKRVIDQFMTPAFKEGDYESGLFRGVLALIKKIDPVYFEQENSPSLSQVNKKDSLATASPLVWIFRVIIFIILFILFLKNPTLFLLVLSGHGRGGGYRGGGGGFGGYSGGGGGFSGGGASGRW